MSVRSIRPAIGQVSTTRDFARRAAATPTVVMWAIEYADAGLHPIELHGFDADGACTCGGPEHRMRRADDPPEFKTSAGKHPRQNNWQTRPLDIEALCAALTKHPAANLGLRMGMQPNGRAIVALDKDDLLKAKRLEKRIGKLPRTLATVTGRGEHGFFEVDPKDLAKLKNFTARDGIDLKTEGGQVAAAPSVHYSGERYKTTIRPVAKLPRAWLDWLLESPKAKAPTSADAVELTPLHNRELDLCALLPYLAPAGVDDARHALSRAIGGWAGKLGFRSDAAARAVALLPSDHASDRAEQARQAAERARTEPNTTGWQYLEERFPSEALRQLEQANQDPMFNRLAERLRAKSANDVSASHGELDGTGLHIHAATGWPWILQRGATYWMHSLSEPRYGRQFPAAELVTRVARDMSGYVSEDDRKPKILFAKWTSTVERVVFSYTALQTTYEPEARAVHVAALDRMPAERATFHEPIDRWMRALLGDDYERGAQWLASCASLDRPAPCLYLIGTPEIGKSLLFDGLARLWGQSSPVHMGEVVSDFNEKQCECPLVFSDEGLPPGLEFSRFRRLVTEHDRSVNRKNLAKVDTTGCARVAIGANNDGVLRWARHGELTGADQAAIAARLLVIHCGGTDAVDALRGQPTEQWANHMIAEHVLHLAGVTQLETGGRMCVQPHGGEVLIRAVVNDRYAPVARAVLEALQGGKAARKAAHVWRSQRDDRVIYVHAEQLHSWIGDRERNLRVGDVREACRALALPGNDVTSQQWLPDSKLRIRVYKLDASRVGDAAGVVGV